MRLEDPRQLSSKKDGVEQEFYRELGECVEKNCDKSFYREDQLVYGIWQSGH